MTTSDGMDKIWERYDQDFLAEPQNRIYRHDKARFENQSLLDNLYRERRAGLFYVSKEDEDQYIEDVALLCRVTMREQVRVPPEDITEEEGISSSESDSEPDSNEDGDLHPHQAQKGSRPKQQKENEYTTRSGQLTSVN
ncbi:hypothetical protein MMC31_001129 [Peltigera leucophlebia]|nr:hypothetical protein [Peltigera leucophlebia]